MATPSFSGPRSGLYCGHGQEGKQPPDGTLLAGFLDELVRLRADFEQRLARIEQALTSQMPDRPAHV